ncbi:hypothetical protein YC2023_061798 [Brassica napus]
MILKYGGVLTHAGRKQNNILCSILSLQTVITRDRRNTKSKLQIYESFTLKCSNDENINGPSKSPRDFLCTGFYSEVAKITKLSKP